jgi:hypothetical protein
MQTMSYFFYLYLLYNLSIIENHINRHHTVPTIMLTFVLKKKVRIEKEPELYQIFSQEPEPHQYDAASQHLPV